LTDNLWKETRL